jgi:hypothetical protein
VRMGNLLEQRLIGYGYMHDGSDWVCCVWGVMFYMIDMYIPSLGIIIDHAL